MTTKYDPTRERERHLAKAYAEFAKAAYTTYSLDTARQRLIMVRQFCQFLVDGSLPVINYPPAKPRP